MGFGETLKGWGESFMKNKIVSEALASNTLKSAIRWGAVGGSLGAVQGVARRVGGDNNASVVGGAVSGAVGFVGARAAWGGARKIFGGAPKMSARATAAHAAANASGGARSAKAGAAYAAAARGRVGSIPSAGSGI